MAKKIGINGQGQIGLALIRTWYRYFQHCIELKVINTSGSINVEQLAFLLEHSSNYGYLGEKVNFEILKSPAKATENDPLIGYLFLGERKIAVTVGRDPAKIPWSRFEVESVLECTGKFLTYDQAQSHLSGSVQNVILSGPPKDQTHIYLPGVKNYMGQEKIISAGSCTTSCVAPIVKAISDKLTIEKGHVTSVHAYTPNQNLLDGSHKDMRRGRAMANIIPTSTGVAATLEQLLPKTKDNFSFSAVRVPVPVGSYIEVIMLISEKVTATEINDILIEASCTSLSGILKTSNQPLVSSDVLNCYQPCLVTLDDTVVEVNGLVKVCAFFDNVVGFCNQMLTSSLQNFVPGKLEIPSQPMAKNKPDQ